jgi:hypothetical protein
MHSGDLVSESGWHVAPMSGEPDGRQRETSYCGTEVQGDRAA